MSIVVFGSINIDLVARTPRLPTPGETITGHSFDTAPGGKGANQAVACARLGVETRMIGRVGGDVFGDMLVDGLRSAGVDVANVVFDQEVSSGVALIAVDDEAENTIIVVPGANGHVGAADLERLESALDGASSLLLQLEVPLEAVVQAAQLARDKGVRVILDPAPSQPLPSDLYAAVNILTPNTTEAGNLVGFPIATQEEAARAAEVLLERGVKCVIVKMGAQGACAANADGGAFYPAIPVQAVDTVAAGDAFNGALAAALDIGKSLDEALRWGLAAGALAVTKSGAQPSLPTRKALLALLARKGYQQ